MYGWKVKGMRSERWGWSLEDSRVHRIHTIDERAAAVAKGRGAIDVALGETLLELCRGERLIELGFSRIVDYGFERLGLPKRTVYMLRKLAEGLASRPLLRQAVAVGAVSARKALTIMSVATGDDEAAWTGLAMKLTIAELERRIKDAGGEVDRSFEVETLILSMSAEQQDQLDEAIQLAREVIGTNPPRWMCIEAIAMEWKMCALPELRFALERGKLTFSKALLVAKDATPWNILERIDDAATTTCQQVERECTEREDRKNRAQGTRRLWGPKEAMETVAIETVAMAITTAKRLSAVST